MKNVILLLLLCSGLGAQTPICPDPPLITVIHEDGSVDTLGVEMNVPDTGGVYPGGFRIEYTGDSSEVYPGDGVAVGDALGLITFWQPDTSRLFYTGFANLHMEYYPLVISDFLFVREVVDTFGVAYHFECMEKVADLIAEPCYMLRDVPLLLSCDYPDMETLRLRFASAISIEWARQLALMTGMTYFYPVWVSRQ